MSLHPDKGCGWAILAGLALVVIIVIAAAFLTSARAATPSSAQVIPTSDFRPVIVAVPGSPDRELDPGPSGTPHLPAAPSSGPMTRPSASRLSGTASWGCCWAGVVTRLRRGTPIRVCGPIPPCWSGRSEGYGPAVWTGRIADLSMAVFTAICGPLSRGLCRVVLTW